MSELPEVPDLIYPKIDEDALRKTKRSVRPWDIFNKNIEKVVDDVQKERMSICLQCPRLIKATRQCKECGCFMDAKTKLFDAECPLGKWNNVDISIDQFDYKKE
jgi:hypothetical protein